MIIIENSQSITNILWNAKGDRLDHTICRDSKNQRGGLHNYKEQKTKEEWVW